jgi:RNA polymerase-binding transcription factor DksA
VNRETVQNYLERLLSERARLIQRIETLEGKGEGGTRQAMKDSIGELSLYDNHPADVSSELFERGKDIKLCEDAKIILKRVDEAIDLVNSGKHGTCEHCGNDIEEDRLDLIPYTRSEDIADIIWPLPVQKLYGVGEKTSQTLESLGIRTVGALAKIPVELLTEKLGETGRLLSNIASGIDNSPVNPSIWEMPKSIGHETTLTEDSGDKAFILTCILSLSQQVGRRLRQQELVARTVTLKLRYSDFTTLTRANTFSFFTCLDEDIYQTAKGLFLCHWNRARKIRLVGVAVSNLSSKDDFMRQLALFEEDEKRRRATAAMDKVRDRFGKMRLHAQV